jgi:succinyl-diaminopimelate desuccinylase
MAITSDEERGGGHGVKYLVEDVGLECGLAIIPDGGSLNDLIVEEKGIIHLRLIAEGVSAHAARPWLAENALERITNAIGRIRTYFSQFTPGKVDPDDLSTHWFSTCTETMIETPNDSPNRIPELASAVLDIRFVPPMTSQQVLEEIEGLLGRGVSAEPIVIAEPTHLSPDPGFAKITEEVTGMPTRLVRSSGGSDGRFFCAQGIPVLLSRPYVGNLHGRDEWIDIDSMVSYFEICRSYILSKCPQD